MAFTYGFYNAIDHDRTYSATQFGEMFDGLINDGVYSTIGECFMTVPGSGVGVVVKSGRAWFNKTWSVNTADLPLDLGLPDLLLPRIDSVILEVDTRVAVRANAIKVVKGYPAVDPVPPGLTTNDGLYQYPLAYVRVAANATQIIKSDITVVVGQTPCPFVTGILQSVPIDDMYQQWEGQFEEWFANLKTTLTEDVVGNLLYQLGQKVDKADKATKQDALTGTDDSKWMTPLRVKEMVDGQGFVADEIGSISYGGPKTNYLPCDNRELKISEYPELFNKIGFDNGYGTDQTYYVDLEEIFRLQYIQKAFRHNNKIYIASNYLDRYVIYDELTNTHSQVNMPSETRSVWFFELNSTVYIVTFTLSGRAVVIRLSYADSFVEVKSQTVYTPSYDVNRILSSDPYIENNSLYIACFVRDTRADRTVFIRFNFSSSTFTTMANLSGVAPDNINDERIVRLQNIVFLHNSSGVRKSYDLITSNVISLKDSAGNDANLSGVFSLNIYLSPSKGLAYKIEFTNLISAPGTLVYYIMITKWHYNRQNKTLIETFYTSSRSFISYTSSNKPLPDTKYYSSIRNLNGKLYFMISGYHEALWIPIYKILDNTVYDEKHTGDTGRHIRVDNEFRQLVELSAIDISANTDYLDSRFTQPLTNFGRYIIHTRGIRILNTFRLPYIKDAYIKVK